MLFISGNQWRMVKISSQAGNWWQETIENDKGIMIRDRRETVYARKKGGKEIRGRDEQIERQSSTLTPVLSSSPENGEHHIEKMRIHNCLLASKFSVCPIGQTGASDDGNCFIRIILIFSLTNFLDQRAWLMGTEASSDIWWGYGLVLW